MLMRFLTLPGSRSEYPKDKSLNTSENGFIFRKINENWSTIKQGKKNLASHFGNYPIYPLLSTWISTWTEPEALYE